MFSKAPKALLESTRKMMESGEAVLADPACPESMKKMVRAEMENQKRCMEMLSDVIKSA